MLPGRHSNKPGTLVSEMATSQNGDRNGYSQNDDKPKQHLYSSSDAYIIDRRLYTYMTCNCCYMKKVQYSIARNA